MLHSSHGAVLLWTAVAYQLMASSNAQTYAPGYLGCFEDRSLITNLFLSGRSLGGRWTSFNTSMSVEWCFNFCLNIEAYKYAGLESKTECYCGSNEDYGRFGRKDNSECRDTCPGNSNQFCGGNWRISIYQISKGVCSKAIGPPDHGTHEVTNPAHVSFNLDNFKFFGTRVRFECETGYSLQGAQTIECKQRENIAEWSDPVPTCTVAPLTSTSYTATNNTQGGPLNIPGVTDGPALSPQQGSLMKTGTIFGMAAGVVASLTMLLVIVVIIYRKRKRRPESEDVATGAISTTLRIYDVTPESAYDYEIPNGPRAVNPHRKERDVTTASAYEIPSPQRAVNPQPKKADVTVESRYEIPRRPETKIHKFTPEQSSNGIVHEYADIKLTSLIQN